MIGRVKQVEDGVATVECHTKSLKVGDTVDVTKPKTDNARKYAWHLMNEVALKVDIDRLDQYEDMLKHYAPRTSIKVDANVNFHSYHKHCEVDFDYGDEIEWVVYKGMSEFSREEMSAFIQGLEHEAEQFDIPTKSSEEVEHLIKEWNNG